MGKLAVTLVLPLTAQPNYRILPSAGSHPRESTQEPHKCVTLCLFGCWSLALCMAVGSATKPNQDCCPSAFDSQSLQGTLDRHGPARRVRSQDFRLPCEGSSWLQENAVGTLKFHWFCLSGVAGVHHAGCSKRRPSHPPTPARQDAPFRRQGRSE
jgi:hypothetical protein